ASRWSDATSRATVSATTSVRSRNLLAISVMEAACDVEVEGPLFIVILLRLWSGGRQRRRLVRVRRLHVAAVGKRHNLLLNARLGTVATRDTRKVFLGTRL